MITVHHLEHSRSQRILWLLEMLGVDYEVKRYARNPKTRLAPPELKQVHPLGKSPVITDGAHTVAESGAIVEYLVDRYDTAGALAPERGSDERLIYTQWLHYAEGSIMPYLLMRLVFSMLPKQAPKLARPLMRGIEANVMKQFLGPMLKGHFDYIEAALKPTGHFVGDRWSAADVLMSFPLEAIEARAGGTSDYPAICAFVERARAEPSYQRALERGGPYELMG